MDRPNAHEVMDTARCVVTASFLHDEDAVRRLVDEEDDPLYLIMALGHLTAQTFARFNRRQDRDPFEVWQEGLQRLAQGDGRR